MKGTWTVDQAVDAERRDVDDAIRVISNNSCVKQRIVDLLK